jgi:dihydrofolate reductase
MRDVKIIMAHDLNGAIGKDNAMAWHIPEEFSHFAQITRRTAVVMGAKTFESLGCKPLPLRHNVVLSTNPDKYANIPGVQCVPDKPSLDVLIEQMNKRGCEIFVIGGAALYEMYIDDATDVYLTCVHTQVEGADASIKPLNEDDFIKFTGELRTNGDIPWQPFYYRRKRRA